MGIAGRRKAESVVELYEIIPQRLWLSPAPTPEYYAELEARGIRTVISLSDAHRLPLPIAELHVFWPIVDGPLPDLNVLRELADFACGHMRLGYRVLVCCDAGVNRSGLLAAMVVWRWMGCSGRKAVDIVRERRPGALTNPAFVEYLSMLPPTRPWSSS